MDKPKIVCLAPRPIEAFTLPSLATRVDLSTVEVTGISPWKATEDQICEAVAGATVIIGDYSAHNYISRRVMEAVPGLRHIQFGSIGFDGVDIKAARELGVTVSNGFGNGVAVAEHTIMLILMLLRNAVYSHNTTLQGQWVQFQIWNDITPFTGKTLGILGLGTIGRQVAKRSGAFDVKIIYNKRNRLSETEEKKLGVEYRTFDQLLEQSDILTIHVPLTDETRGMIGKNELAKMKDGAMLINTARGTIVDEAALADALRAGKLLSAAIDYEPVDIDSPLRGLENVIITPHTGTAGATAEAKKAEGIDFAENIARALAGERPLNIVNGL